MTGPSYLQPERAGQPLSTGPSKSEVSLSLSGGKPLSPILSPGAGSKPVLKVDTGQHILETPEVPPKVPPKLPSLERKGSLAPKLSAKSTRTQILAPATSTPSAITPNSALDARQSPNVPHSALTSSPPSALSPQSAVERRGSPKPEARRDGTTSHNRNMSDTSILDRGRPIKRSIKRQRSRTCSEVNNTDVVVADSWKLPTGMRATDASLKLDDIEKENLRKQAFDQAEKFEVLNKRDVTSLSRVSYCVRI